MKSRKELANVLRGIAESSVLTAGEADDLDTIVTLLENTGRMAIVLEGGRVQAVVSDNPYVLGDIDIAVIDYDTEGVDRGELRMIVQSNGDLESAIVYHTGVTTAEIGLDGVFDDHELGTLRQEVFDALNNALDSGYDMRAEDPAAVARDLTGLDADIENHSPEEVEPFVKEWQASKREG